MRTAYWTILCFFLLIPFPAAAEPAPDQLPYHFAVVMPAEIVESFEDSPEVYDGVEFPLFCGFVSVYPKENKFAFTKTTDLPITWIQKVLGKIEPDGYIERRDLYTIKTPVNDSYFGTAFTIEAEVHGFKVFYIGVTDEVPLDMAPKFTRTCLYDSKKQPPVDCGYDKWDIDDLRIPYDWEIELQKEEEQKRLARQNQ